MTEKKTPKERPIQDAEYFQSVLARMLEIREVSALAETALESGCEALGASRGALFLLKSEGGYETVSGERALLPEQAILDYVKEDQKLITMPLSGVGAVTVFPLLVRERHVGVAVLDVTPVAEETAQADLSLLQTFLHRAGALVRGAMVLASHEERSALLTNILDSISNGILTLDPENRLTRLNRNAMAMLELSQADLGKKMDEALGREVAGAVVEMTEEFEKQGFAMERMVTREFSNGLKISMAISVSPLTDGTSGNLGMTVVFRDMTASRELDRLRRLDEMKNEFVSNVSHELKTPLTSIKAYTEALSDMATDETQKNFLQVIDEESDRLLFLINDLLNVSRIQSGKMEVHLEMTSPETIVLDVLNISKVQSEKHEIVCDIAENLPPMQLDLEKMKEVIINLISNAIKYSPEGGKVYVRMREKEANLLVEVEDEGLGISEENLPKVFDSFYRVDSSLTAEIPGTGLGLAIVQAIVQLHGGKVWVESVEGKGSTFCFMLPFRSGAETNTALRRMS